MLFNHDGPASATIHCGLAVVVSIGFTRSAVVMIKLGGLGREPIPGLQRWVWFLWPILWPWDFVCIAFTNESTALAVIAWPC